MTIPQFIRTGILACAGMYTFSMALAADAPDELDAIRALVQAGATQLALQRIEMLQPGDAAAPPPKGTSFGASPKGISFGASPKGTSFGARWVEWEHLRLQVLASSNRHAEVLKHVDHLPATLPADARADLQALAAQSALALGQGAAARAYAARVLWAPGASLTPQGDFLRGVPQGDFLRGAQIRDMRLLVIRSHVRESRAADAYGSMLRFQQDYRPLDAVIAAEFVDALLDLDRVKEAVDWLGMLEEGSAVKLRLRLRTGLVKPQEAVVLARAALPRAADARWWRVILDAAQRLPSAVLRLEALEQLVDAPMPQAVTAAQLWDAYDEFARESANTHHLLAGDDAGWLDFAQRRRVAEPVVARAYFAYLSRTARVVSVRQSAQAQLAAGYVSARLSRAGLRLFVAATAGLAPLGDETRYALGDMAEAVGDPARALDYRKGLSAPAGIAADEWHLRLSAMALRANRAAVANDLARRLGAEKSPLIAAQVQTWMVLSQQFADYGQHDSARLLLERVLPYADKTAARAVLAGLGRAHEAHNDYQLAADFYLRSALSATTPDAVAADARLRAGLALVRAGLLEDARVQFEWLLQHAKDPAQTAIARRELGR